MSENRLKTHGWIALWLLLLVVALYCRPPLPIDETRYLSVAWEMWQSRQWLVPHINGLPYSHKPPLLFWLIEAGWVIFGVNPWSARLTAPIFGLFAVALTMRLARMLWPDRPHLRQNIPYLLLGTCLWSFYSTLTLFDMLLACFALLAWLGLAIERAAHRGWGWGLYAVAFGLGILAKGPIIAVYVMPPALLAPWWMSKAEVGSWPRWYGGFVLAIVLGAALALAWAIPAAKTGGEQYAQAIFLGQTVGRVVHSFAHQRPLYWYLILLPLLLFPWSFVPETWAGLRRLPHSPASRFCFSILGPGILALSLISGKQIHYLLPLLPPLVLLMARSLCLENRCKVVLSSRLLPSVLLLLALLLSIIPHLPLKGGDNVMLAYLPQWLGLGPLVVAIFFMAPWPKWGDPIVRIAIAQMVLLVFLHLALADSLHRLYDSTAIGRTLQEAQEAGQEIAVYPDRLSDQFQFAGRLTAPLVPQSSLDDAALWSQQHPRQQVLFCVGNDEYAFFHQYGVVQPYKNAWLILCSTEDFVAAYQQWSTRND
jgi:4-amino-4-deoxy-L-arabinose transferase-like glycosyltransferase